MRCDIHVFHSACRVRLGEALLSGLKFRLPVEGDAMTGIRTFGNDISHYSEDIEWPVVIQQKVHFAIAKASELYTNSSGQVSKAPDPYFPTYWNGMKANNVLCGAFHFCHPEIDPDAAMAMFFDIYAPDKGDLLPALDIEDDYTSNTEISKFPCPIRLARYKR